MKKLMTLMAGVAMLALFMPMQASAQSGQNAKLGLVVVITPGSAAAEEIKRLEAFGQTLPAIITADGVAEARNRRVEIFLGVK